MTIHSTRAKLPSFAAGLVAGTLLLAATGSSHAVPQVGSVTVKSEEAIVRTVQGRAYDRGTLYRPPLTIQPPPSPRVRDHREVRDHRGGGNKTTSSAPGGVMTGDKTTSSAPGGTVTEGRRRTRKSTTVCFPCSIVGERSRDHRKDRDHRGK